jgi:hypothetical protein
MHHPVPRPLVPGSWDELVARGALHAVNWLHDRLQRRQPTLASAPLPADPCARLVRLGGTTTWQRRAPRN